MLKIIVPKINRIYMFYDKRFVRRTTDLTQPSGIKARTN